MGKRTGKEPAPGAKVTGQYDGRPPERVFWRYWHAGARVCGMSEATRHFAQHVASYANDTGGIRLRTRTGRRVDRGLSAAFLAKDYGISERQVQRHLAVLMDPRAHSIPMAPCIEIVDRIYIGGPGYPTNVYALTGSLAQVVAREQAWWDAMSDWSHVRHAEHPPMYDTGDVHAHVRHGRRAIQALKPTVHPSRQRSSNRNPQHRGQEHEGKGKGKVQAKAGPRDLLVAAWDWAEGVGMSRDDVRAATDRTDDAAAIAALMKRYADGDQRGARGHLTVLVANVRSDAVVRGDAAGQT